MKRRREVSSDFSNLKPKGFRLLLPNHLNTVTSLRPSHYHQPSQYRQRSSTLPAFPKLMDHIKSFLKSRLFCPDTADVFLKNLNFVSLSDLMMLRGVSKALKEVIDSSLEPFRVFGKKEMWPRLPRSSKDSIEGSTQHQRPKEAGFESRFSK